MSKSIYTEEDLEELEDIRLYVEAKLSDEPYVPIDEAFKMIEVNRKLNGLSGC